MSSFKICETVNWWFICFEYLIPTKWATNCKSNQKLIEINWRISFYVVGRFRLDQRHLGLANFNNNVDEKTQISWRKFKWIAFNGLSSIRSPIDQTMHSAKLKDSLANKVSNWFVTQYLPASQSNEFLNNIKWRATPICSLLQSIFWINWTRRDNRGIFLFSVHKAFYTNFHNCSFPLHFKIPLSCLRAERILEFIFIWLCCLFATHEFHVKHFHTSITQFSSFCLVFAWVNWEDELFICTITDAHFEGFNETCSLRSGST